MDLTGIPNLAELVDKADSTNIIFVSDDKLTVYVRYEDKSTNTLHFDNGHWMFTQGCGYQN